MQDEKKLNNLLDYSLEELKEIVKDLGEKEYRADQLYKWLNAGVPFEKTSNLSKSFLSDLRENYSEGYAILKRKQVSKDGTVKYLFGMQDDIDVESVLMKQSYGNTLCVSTQAGCKMRCNFCVSGMFGLERNLTAGEILAQVIGANSDGIKVNNIVLMGMGEPFDNYDNVIKFLKLVNDERGLNIGWRSISLSTCGVVPKIIEFSKENLPITLAVSLHAPNDEIRKKIMPIANKYTINEVIDSAKYYFNKTGRRVIIEYVLLEGVNASKENAKELSKLLSGLNCHVNLIPFNSGSGEFKKPSFDVVKGFLSELEKNRISATIRKTSGDDIDGACGQLKLITNKNMAREEKP
jgi:23S rRNA (adenine2503-C2)-methyltransferase